MSSAIDGVGVGMMVGRGVAVGASGAIGATAGAGVLVGVAGGAGDEVGRWAIAGLDASCTCSCTCSATLLSGVRPDAGAGVGVGGEGDAHARRSKTRKNAMVDLVIGLVSLRVDIYSLRSLGDSRLRRTLISIIQLDDLSDERQGISLVDYNVGSHGAGFINQPANRHACNQSHRNRTTATVARGRITSAIAG